MSSPTSIYLGNLVGKGWALYQAVAEANALRGHTYAPVPEFTPAYDTRIDVFWMSSELDDLMEKSSVRTAIRFMGISARGPARVAFEKVGKFPSRILEHN